MEDFFEAQERGRIFSSDPRDHDRMRAAANGATGMYQKDVRALSKKILTKNHDVVLPVFWAAAADGWRQRGSMWIPGPRPQTCPQILWSLWRLTLAISHPRGLTL